MEFATVGVPVLVGVLLAQADAPECRNPPTRLQDAYWPYVEACGCEKLEPPAKTSEDYERFLKACSLWRQRNPQINVIVPGAAARASEAAAPASAPECRSPPSRTSDTYWRFAEACGCADLEPPPKISEDYERFLKTCSLWRQRSPQIRMVPAPAGGQPGGRY